MLCRKNTVGPVCGTIVMVKSEETSPGMPVITAEPSEESNCRERKVPSELMVTVAVALDGGIAWKNRADAVQTQN